MRAIIWILFGALLLATQGRQSPHSSLNPDNIPDEVRSCVRNRPEIRINGDVNPFLISGDFDGDGFTDFAVQVTSTKGEKGILVCFSRKDAVLIGGGSGTPWKQTPAERWPFDSWFLVPKGSKQLSIYPQIRFDALALLVADEAGGLVYWDGHKLRWQQEE